jgi:hypothetical protein
LTESNRSAGRAPYRQKPDRKAVEEMRAWLFQPPSSVSNSKDPRA